MSVKSLGEILREEYPEFFEEELEREKDNGNNKGSETVSKSELQRRD
jgi:hypothetical protein